MIKTIGYLFNLIVDNSIFILSILKNEIVLSLILFVLILVIATLLRKRSPHWQFGLWSLVLLRLLLPPDMHFSYSAYNLFEQVKSGYNKMTTGSNSDVLKDGRTLADIENNSMFWDFILKTDLSKVRVNGVFSVPAMTVCVWLTGMLLVFLLFLKRIIGYHRLLSSAFPVMDVELQRIMFRWQKQFGIRRRIQLFSSKDYLSPFTNGILRPKIFLPEILIETSESETLQSIIAHEMAHIKRLDALWIKLQNIVQILYFFHPVVWYASSQLNLARERLCDSMVLSTRTISTETYGQSLLTILNMKTFGLGGAQLSLGFGSQKKRLMNRFEEINGGQAMKKHNKIFVFCSVIILGFLLLPMANRKIGSQKNVLAATGSTLIESRVQQSQALEFSPPIKSGRITSTFGQQINPFTKKRAFHVGVDIAVKEGTDVFASAAGVVEKAYSNIDKEHPGYGKYIIIDHGGGVQTLYSHLSKIIVEEKQKVKQGDRIGGVGNTGKSTGPHLHYELIMQKKNVNPEEQTDFEGLKRIN